MKLYLAPMEGITTFLYRNAFCRYYGGIDKYFTPFIASSRLNYKEINEILPEHNAGIPLVPQILANRADTFLAIADQIAEHGYREVNLNLGCPSGTVVSKKRGAGFLSVPEELDRFLDQIFEQCPLEISIKTRIGISSLQEWENLLSIYAKYPLKELIIHPRLQKEFYGGRPHLEAFVIARDVVHAPLCYNGDINSQTSWEELCEQIAPVDSAMLGRGAIANPQLPSILKNKSSAAAKDLKTFEAFHDEILNGYLEYMSGEQPALFRMKELWVYMGKYLDLSDRQMKQIRKVNCLREYRNLVQGFLAS